MVRLVTIFEYAEEMRLSLLYDLLAEREEHQSISHKKMPTMEQHWEFVENHPYASWDFIVDGPFAVGSIYLTKPARPSVAGNEIGIAIFRAHQRKGYATQAINALIERNGPGRYLANVAPGNHASNGLFLDQGFSLCQYTFEKVVE